MMKQFVKALDKNNASFEYLCKKIPRLSDAKIKEGGVRWTANQILDG